MIAPECRVDYRRYAAREVRWYRKNGEHLAARIKRDDDGVLYVIGDHSWNRTGRPSEWIERKMRRGVQL